MPSFRMLKARLRDILSGEDWEAGLGALDDVPPRSLVGPIVACLPMEEPVASRAAKALGRVAARLSDLPDGREQTADLVRRLMWHMNEESGNIGWGIPEAFAEVLAARRPIAEKYATILISYVIDTGHEDNFCDHAVLRRSCFKAVTRLIEAWPDLPCIGGLGSLCSQALTRAMELDPDEECRRLAKAASEVLAAARAASRLPR